MRKLLVLSIVALAAGAAGCTRGPCGESWRPGYYLFGAGRQSSYGYQNYGYGYQAAGACCDPCSGGTSAMMAAPSMMTADPVMTQAPCCQ